jgi:hypothetical protein
MTTTLSLSRRFRSLVADAPRARHQLELTAIGKEQHQRPPPQQPGDKVRDYK